MRLCAILAFLVCSTVSEAQSVRPGTYRVWFCRMQCTPADSLLSVAEAVLVIVDSPTAAAASTKAFLAGLPHQLVRVPTATAPDNACFRVTRERPAIRADERFWRHPEGVATRVERQNTREFSLLVDSSPDSYYHLVWKEPGVLTSGEGRVTAPFMAAVSHRHAFFTARRVGVATLNLCAKT